MLTLWLNDNAVNLAKPKSILVEVKVCFNTTY
jgi:hypothetical protein